MRLALGVTQAEDPGATGQYVVAVTADAVTHRVAFVFELVGKHLVAWVVQCVVCFTLRIKEPIVPGVFSFSRLEGPTFWKLFAFLQLHPPQTLWIRRSLTVGILTHKTGLLRELSVRFDLLSGTPSVDVRDTANSLLHAQVLHRFWRQLEMARQAGRWVEGVAELVDEVGEAELINVA